MVGLVSVTPKKTWPHVALAPGQKIRVLIVDDSVVARRIITHALADDRELEVIGSAPSAEIALQKIQLMKPDVLTLDINMPDMTGLDLLPILRELYPELHVVMLSVLTASGASQTLDALMLGASDCASKPTEDAKLGNSLLQLREEIVPKIKQFFQRTGSQLWPVRQSTAPAAPSVQQPITQFRPMHRGGERQILAVGVSTGGPTALATFIGGFDHAFPLPIVIVQHMPAVFTGLLAERLRTLTGFNVVEATHGMLLEPGKAIIAPGDFHMRLARVGAEVRVSLDQAPPECSCRPAVDVLFRSVSQVFGAAAIGAVLTGMGQDGLRGAEELKRGGAYLIAQDEASSVVWGMPGAVVHAGIADEVLDLGSIVSAVMKQVGN